VPVLFAGRPLHAEAESVAFGARLRCQGDRVTSADCTANGTTAIARGVSLLATSSANEYAFLHQPGSEGVDLLEAMMPDRRVGIAVRAREIPEP
jgi:hypothetical protein